jgi:hypothetical protein
MTGIPADVATGTFLLKIIKKRNTDPHGQRKFQHVEKVKRVKGQIKGEIEKGKLDLQFGNSQRNQVRTSHAKGDRVMRRKS